MEEVHYNLEGIEDHAILATLFVGEKTLDAKDTDGKASDEMMSSLSLDEEHLQVD